MTNLNLVSCSACGHDFLSAQKFGFSMCREHLLFRRATDREVEAMREKERAVGA